MRFIAKVLRVATKRRLYLCLAITVIAYVVMTLILMPFLNLSGGLLPLDMRVSYTLADVNQLFTTLGTTGRQLYSLFQMVDTIFPIALAITMMMLLAMISQRISTPPSHLTLITFIPLGGAIADYIENILIATQLLYYPTFSLLTITIASLFTTIKWGLMLLIFILVMVLGVYSLSKLKTET